MANCPFRVLAEEHRDLVCHMNHELLSGVTEEAGLPPGAARLDPDPERCCVTIVV
jgi:predicted ArsR family transcriptional regulator